MKILCIFALLLFASCEVEEEQRVCRLEMTFSDGLPVQFWLTDCETFNEKEVPGINPACWCQPFNCSDVINIQFKDDTGQTLYLAALNSEGAVVAYVECQELSEGVYSASFVPEDEEVCDTRIHFKIFSSLTEGDEVIENSGFHESDVSPDDLSPWESVAGTGMEWFQEGADGPVVARASISFPSGAGESNPLRQDITEQTQGSYNLLLRFGSTGDPSNVTLKVTVFNGADEVAVLYEDNVVNLDEFVDVELTTYIPGSFDRIEIIASKSGPNEFTYSVSTCSLVKLVFTDEVAKSDCLHIKTSHSGTELIEYSNNRNFAGLIYDSDLSPSTTFFLRVPAVFFHKRFPQESRAIERTTSTIVTSSKLKKQRLLQVEHVPEYFHEKIIIALSHHNVEIDGKQWKKEEGYEMDEGDPKYPLKKATCYLTEKNFLARNTL